MLAMSNSELATQGQVQDMLEPSQGQHSLSPSMANHGTAAFQATDEYTMHRSNLHSVHSNGASGPTDEYTNNEQDHMQLQLNNLN